MEEPAIEEGERKRPLLLNETSGGVRESKGEGSTMKSG